MDNNIELDIAALGKTTYNITNATGDGLVIRKPSSIVIDNYGKELQEKEPRLLDLTVNDGDIHQFAAGYIPSHWHKELEAFILLEGRVRIGAGDSTYSLRAGEGCFINTEAIHSFTADVSSACHYRSFVFNPDMIAGMPGSIFDIAYVRPLLENGIPFMAFCKENGDDVYFEQFERAYSAFASEEYGYEFRVRDALSNIVLYAKSKGTSVTSCASTSVKEARLKEMLTWIDNHLGKNITVSEIAAAANVCTRECQRIFQQYLHDNPISYVRRKRIFQAARLLADTDSPVTDIALNCGFSNPSYFSKQFGELMGSTPVGYRRMCKDRS